MTDSSGDSRQEPDLELPSFKLFGRKKKQDSGSAAPTEEPASSDPPRSEPTPGPAPVATTGTVRAGDQAAEPTPATTSRPTKPVPETQTPADNESAAARRQTEEEAVARRREAEEQAAAEDKAARERAELEAVEAKRSAAREKAERKAQQREAKKQRSQEKRERRTAKKQRRAAKAKARAARTDPLVSPPLAALVVGAAAGLVLVGLIYGFMSGCAVVRGTTSCGSSGLWLLILAMILVVGLATLVFKQLKIGEALATSFLGVGLLAALAMLFFLGSIFSWWMVLVIPALAALTFIASLWVTSNFTDAPTDTTR